MVSSRMHGGALGVETIGIMPASMLTIASTILINVMSIIGLSRNNKEETLRRFLKEPEPMLPQPCRLCDKAFPSREQFLLHVDAEHGGLQRYRNAFFCLASLRPHIVGGQEWRLAIASFNEFIARAATDWQHFTTSMTETLETAEGLPVDARWEPRRQAACVFCARFHWPEELKLVYL